MLGFLIKLQAASLPVLNNTNNPTPLGKSINTVEAKSYADFATRDVLSFDYYSSMKYYDNSYYTDGSMGLITETSKKSAMLDIQQKYTMEAQVKGVKVKMFTLNAKGSFSESASYKESNYVSNIWSNVYDTKIFGQQYLLSDYYEESYKNHLSSGYLSALNSLANGSMSYETFFKLYGTHIITKYTLGDEFNLDISVHTNSRIIDTDLALKISSEFSAAIIKPSAEVSEVNDIKAKYSLEEEKTVIKTSCHTASSLSCNVSDDIKKCHNEWNEKSTRETATIIGYPDGGLVPLWEVLPDNSPISSGTMEEKFRDYARANEAHFDSSVHTFPNVISGTCLSRPGRVNVSDCDRFSNGYDNFTLSCKYGLPVLKTAYKYLELTFTFDLRKANQGTRYLYVYDSADVYKGSKQHNKYLAYTNKITCDKKGTIYTGRTVKLQIKTSALSSNNLAIVWRASGNGKDSWWNENLSVNYRFYN